MACAASPPGSEGSPFRCPARRHRCLSPRGRVELASQPQGRPPATWVHRRPARSPGPPDGRLPARLRRRLQCPGPRRPGDGVTDDTASLQRAFDRAGAVGGAVLLPAGAYRFSAPLGIRGDRTELLGLGGSRLVPRPALDRLIDSNDFSRLRFHGSTIEGSGVQAVGGRGSIHLDGGSRYCVVSQCRIVNAPGTAIADDGARNLDRSQRRGRDGRARDLLVQRGGVGLPRQPPPPDRPGSRDDARLPRDQRRRLAVRARWWATRSTTPTA